MAADDYYRGSLIDNYNYNTPPAGRSPALNDYPASFTPYSTSNTSLHSKTPAPPSYRSTEQIPLSQNVRSHQQKRNMEGPPENQYIDNPVSGKFTSKLRNSKTMLVSESTMSPESPESLKESKNLPKTRRRDRGGFFTGRIPWVVFVTTLVQVSVFIGEIIKNSIVTGSPIMIHPQFNPMIGPSTYILINMGARALCGFGGLDDANPDQWFRFIVPIFLHAGIIHIGFNMLLQLTMAREMELAIGSVRFGLVYFSSGIFGFVLGGNFAATAIASTGASGCLFGILALTLLELVYRWNERRHPVKDLMFLLGDVIISFILGLLPGLDNFSHIGGFLMGLVAGICILHSPNVLRQRIDDTRPYRTIDKSSDSASPRKKAKAATTADVGAFAKEPVGFFKGRKPLWWAWWLIRAGALLGVLIGFIILLRNFYVYRDTCSWCKYLSCLPINNWCSIGNLQLTQTSTNSNNNRRDLLGTTPVVRVMATELWRRAGRA